MKTPEDFIRKYASFEFDQWKKEHPDQLRILSKAMVDYHNSFNQWISVNDRKPKDGQDVICSNGTKVFFAQFQIDSNLDIPQGCFMIQRYTGRDRELTNSWADIIIWMPLPKLPGAEI